LHCSATGKLFLTFLYHDRLDEFCAQAQPQIRTPKTKIDLDSIQKMTEQVKQQGFALDDEEYHLGVRCLAAPVFDMSGQIIAAMDYGPATEISLR
jgi:DNA-binding IclR family transcriptional regulator